MIPAPTALIRTIGQASHSSPIERHAEGKSKQETDASTWTIILFLAVSDETGDIVVIPHHFKDNVTGMCLARLPLFD